ncbi:MAG: hypothetical protein ACRC7N_17685 [Clostridium sp.]
MDKITITGKELLQYEVVIKDIYMTESPNVLKYVLLKGKVLGLNDEIMKNAAIEIYTIDSLGNETFVGITFSDEKGEYGISVPCNKEIIFYKIIAYST